MTDSDDTRQDDNIGAIGWALFTTAIVILSAIVYGFYKSVEVLMPYIGY